jgi:hypothetical protein
MRRSSLILSLLFLSLSVVTCVAQKQEYVARYSAFGAFSYFGTPSLNSVQRGFDGDFGVNVRSWLTLGGDFSYGSGSTSLLPNQLNAATQAKLAPYVPLLVSKGIPLAVPYNSSTYTYEAGPQFNYRGLKHFTLFARPALGALHTTITATPSNPYIANIVGGLLGKSMSSSDTVVFYGFGGGITWEATPHFGIRVATDLVHYNMFSDILNGGRNTVRVVVGTKYSWGRNILVK